MIPEISSTPNSSPVQTDPSKTVPDPSSLAGDSFKPEKISHYQLLEKIGEGGFGEVWLAEQREPVKRRVAVKIIKLGMDTRQVIARFEAERQALALMDHPNIAKVHDGGATAAGRPYFVMELVKGVPITEYCNSTNIDTEGRLNLFILVCRAIQHAHQKGIIHRDIKPSNVLVTMQDGTAVPKVIDFGIAKATQQPLTEKTLFTQLQQFIGTPAYMSPEQAAMTGIDIDTRSDIYSLGVLLYELLTDSTPFESKELLAAGLDEMRRIIREKEPPRPSTRVSSLGTMRNSSLPREHYIRALRGDLDWIVMKCLEKDRTRRYESANGLTLDVQRYLREEPVAARPPSRAYLLQKLVRRNKVGFAFTAAAACVLAGAALFSSIAYRNERRARTDSESARNTAQAERLRAEAAALRSRQLLYAADMNLASQSLQLGNLGRARRLLDRHRPQGSDADLRGWEWRYLWQGCRSEAAETFGPFAGRVQQVVMLHGGEQFAASLESASRTMGGVGIVSSISNRRNGFNPAAVVFRSQRFAALPQKTEFVIAESNAVQTVDLEGHYEKLFEFRHGALPRLAVSRSGRFIAAQSGEDGAIVVFDYSVRTNVFRVERTRDGNSPWGYVHQRDLIFSHDDRQLIAAPGGNFITVFEVPTGRILRTVEVFREAHVTCLDVSPDGEQLVVGAGYKLDDVVLLNSRSGEVQAKLGGHSGWVSQVRFSPNGKLVATASADQTIRVWDLKSLSLRKVLRGHGDEVWSIAFSPDSGTLVSGGKDGYVLVWDLRGDVQNESHQVFGEKNHLVLPQTRGMGIVRIDSEKNAFFHPKGAPKSSAHLQPVGEWVHGSTGDLLADYDGTNLVRFWRTSETGFVPTGTLGLPAPANSFAHSRQGDRIAWSAGEESELFMTSLSDPSSRIVLTNGAHTPGMFVWDDTALLAYGPNGDKTVWETSSGKLLAALPHVPQPNDVYTLHDRKTILTIGSRRLVFHDIKTGAAQELNVDAAASGQTALSPDGFTLVLGGNDAVIRIYDLQERRLLRRLYGHRFNVTSLAFSPDGHRLASLNGHAEALKVWDWRNGQELMNLPGSGEILDYAFFHGSGAQIFAGDAFGHWQRWQAPSFDDITQAEKIQPPWPRLEE